jgi:UDP-N-acetylmuramate: L-alanyl-gamma-D-glutamyl-meso-diaminopimelate ligase
MQTGIPSIDPTTILNQSLDKQRIVITGSRGRSSLTALLIHTLSYYKRTFDYVISTTAHGLSETSRISNAPIIIIEADETQMLQYNHHIGLISNVMWAASDQFPTEDEYVHQYDRFADNTPKSGILLFCENDPLAMLIGTKIRTDVFNIGYKIHPHTSENGKHFLTIAKEKIPVAVFGSQNFQNISAAKELVRRLGITNEMFYKAVSGFPQ